MVEPSKIMSLIYKILYPKRRIESYSILGTMVSPDKIPEPPGNREVCPLLVSSAVSLDLHQKYEL